MIERTKYVRSMSVDHMSVHVEADEVASEIAPSALDAFLRKDDIKVAEGKIVPYHAVEYVETSVAQEQEEVDNNCDLSCSVMPDPTLTAPTTTLEVDAGVEFDPLEGVSAVDGNGDSVEVTATVETPNDTPIGD